MSANLNIGREPAVNFKHQDTFVFFLTKGLMLGFSYEQLREINFVILQITCFIRSLVPCELCKTLDFITDLLNMNFNLRNNQKSVQTSLLIKSIF